MQTDLQLSWPHRHRHGRGVRSTISVVQQLADQAGMQTFPVRMRVQYMRVYIYIGAYMLANGPRCRLDPPFAGASPRRCFEPLYPMSIHSLIRCRLSPRVLSWVISSDVLCSHRCIYYREIESTLQFRGTSKRVSLRAREARPLEHLTGSKAL